MTIDVADDVWNVVVDPNEFETALVNLVINARDAMPEGGSVVVSAKNITETAQVAISVADTGWEFPTTLLRKCSIRFSLQRRSAKGPVSAYPRCTASRTKPEEPWDSTAPWATAPQ
jgi:signal transduction histidine kinase